MSWLQENFSNVGGSGMSQDRIRNVSKKYQVCKQTDRNRLTERFEHHREEKRDVKTEQHHRQTTKVNQRDDQQSFDSRTSQDIKYHGLLNQGSTCYLNSVLQVLFMTKDFREAVERHTCQTPGAGCVECDLKVLFKDLKDHTAFPNKITRSLGIDNVSEQSDAAECLEKILTQISPEASQIFNGQLTHKTTCYRCRTDTYEGSFWHLSLPLVDSRVETYSVVKGTEKFFKVSHMSGENQLFCDDCDAKADAAVKYEVKHHPEVLMLELKRFNFDYRYMTYVKNYRSVDVPYSLQIPEDQTYELYAVVEHSGSFRDGHYSATIKSQDDETWYKFNNDTVTPVFFQSFKFSDTEMFGDAYLLFYRKKKTTAETKGIREESTKQGLVPVTTDNDDQCQGAKKTSKREQTVEESMDRNKGTGTRDTVTDLWRGVVMSPERMYKAEDHDNESLDNVSHIIRDEGHKWDKDLQTISVDKKRYKKKKGLDVNNKGQKTGANKSLEELKNRRVGDSKQKVSGNHEVYKQTDRNRLTERNERHREEKRDVKREQDHCQTTKVNQRDDQQSFDSHTSQDIKYHGLWNQGSTCYLNSVLQVLFMTKDFREAVERHTCQIPGAGCVECHLKILFEDLKDHTAFTYKITRSLGIDNVSEQSDAAECFKKILTQISPEASQIFNGQLTHKTTCSRCRTDTYEGSFWHLSLPLVDSRVETYSVVKGTEKFFKVSHMSGENQLFCDDCDAKADAAVKYEVKHHPEVLMLELKRFNFDYRYMTYVKNYRSVDVPYSLQIPEDQTYELYAVVEHSGSFRDGHYSATIKSQDDETWYKFNNDTVTPVFFQSFKFSDTEMFGDAYLLFYKKRKTTAETKGIREESTKQGLVPVTTDNDDQCQGAKKTSKREQTVEESMDRNKGTGTRDTVTDLWRGVVMSPERMYKAEDHDNESLDNVSHIIRDEGHKWDKDLQTISVDKKRYKKKKGLDVNNKGQKTGANKSLEELKNRRVGDSKQKVSGNHEVYKQTDRNRLTERNERHREEKRDVKREQDHCQTTKVNQRDDQQSFDSHTSQDIKYHGLWNQGSTCYLNSVLQVLFMTKDFREAVERHTCQIPGAGCVECHLKILFEDLKDHTAFTYKITRSLGIDNVSEQSDAAECFKKILTQISPEASQIFNGQLTNKTTCSRCGNIIDEGSFWHLSLPLVDSCRKTYSVVKGTERFFEVSHMSRENQLFCDECDAKADAAVKCEVKHHPEVLMLQLKRFEIRYDRYVKNYCSVDVHYTLQIPEDQTYELYAVVEHSGTFRDGHYSATIKSQDNETWYKFNNDKVTLLRYNSFQLDHTERFGDAYLLFYRKKKTHAAAAAETKDITEVSTSQDVSVRDVEDDKGQKTGADRNLTTYGLLYPEQRGSSVFSARHEQHKEEMRDVKGEQEKKENQRAESVANIREESRHSKQREGNRCDSKLSQKNKMTTEREVLKNQIHHHLAQKHTSPPTVGGISQDGSQRRYVKINVKETSDTNTDEVDNLFKCLSSLSLNESEIL